MLNSLNENQEHEDYGGKSLKNHTFKDNAPIFMHRAPVKLGKPTPPGRQLQQRLHKAIGIKTYKP